MTFKLKFDAYRRLGLANIFKVAMYRLGLRTGLHPAVKLRYDFTGTEFFTPNIAERKNLQAPDFWRHSALLFGWKSFPIQDSPPRWHFNLFTGQEAGGEDQPWWQLSDFSLPVGDIKTVWELSRMDWVVAMAQQSVAGDSAQLTRLNSWLTHWSQQNPAFMGSNWKCGQEASIRVMHLALAARILGQDASPSSDLLVLVEGHLARIHPTLSYAMAQDNNHGTSEAAALFIGGSLLEAGGVDKGAAWARDGRHWLENRVQKLIEPDGSFSQHSLNYHRLLLDTLCLVEAWRLWLNLPAFSREFDGRAQAATQWLFHLIDPESGHGPNLGDSDGANLLPLSGADCRDFRPTVQLAMALFFRQRAYTQSGPHDLHLDWLGFDPPATLAEKTQCKHFSDGGYSVLRLGPWMALFRFPKDRFRPRHCDALHLDLWIGSQNILMDGGSYSYNTQAPWLEYFPGNSGHNTMEFDGHDQMPVVSRFLRGAWLNASGVRFDSSSAENVLVEANYTDWLGCFHARRVVVEMERVLVEDSFSGFQRRAILRWRLQPGQWKLEGSVLKGDELELSIHADGEIKRMEIVEGWQSQYYMQKTPLPVLEIEFHSSGSVTTEIRKL